MQASEDLMREEIIRYAKRILPVRAISPESGGTGESARADEICKNNLLCSVSAIEINGRG